MKSRSTFLGVFLAFLVIASIAHLSLHFSFYGTGYRGFAERGITGMAVEGSEGEGRLPVSEVILFLEWGLIFVGVIFVYAKNRINLRKEYDYLVLLKQKKHFSGGTELDRFYELLKDMKCFRLSTAAKVFDVDIEVVEDWAKSLELSKVAELTYPRVGGPEIRLIEWTAIKTDKEESEEEKGVDD